VRDRAQAVLMAHRGRPHGQVAADLGVAPRTLQRWLNGWAAGKAAGLVPKRPPGATGRIPASLAGDVQGWVMAGPAGCGLKIANWTHAALAAHLGRARGIRVRRSAVGRFCRRHGIRPYRPTYRHLRADPVKQAQSRQDLAGLKKGAPRAG
jgi:transposase